MNCKSIQKSLAVDERLGPRESDHIEACAECMNFADYCKSVERRLNASRPSLERPLLIDGKDRFKVRRDWKGLAMAASALVIVAPIATYLIKSRLAASGPQQPFHVVIKGTEFSFGSEVPTDVEVWFDGKKIRMTMHQTYGIDEISWVQEGVMWQTRRTDHVLKTERVPFAGNPPELVVDGRYASPKFFQLVLNGFAPITPSIDGQAETDAILADGVSCSVVRYQIKPHHVGRVNRWDEDYRSNVWVYTSRASGKIAMIRQAVDEGNGKTATIECDYDYGPIPPSRFDPSTLRTTPTGRPAQEGNKAGG